MARLTSRDYKNARRGSFDLGRWKEFGVGLAAGLAVAVLVFAYAQRNADAGSDEPLPLPRKPEPVAAEGAETGEGDEANRQYDFYEMLPQFEVVVPEKDQEVKRDLPTARIERPGVYVLQAGSYRKVGDAERVRRQLALQGVEATVQRVAVDADVWHRVRIGPIADLEELNRLRTQLRAAEVDALVIRVGE